MNKHLFLNDLKTNYNVFIIFVGILLMYFTIIIGMYDPEAIDSLEGMLAMLPEEMLAAMNFVFFDLSLTGFLATYYYGFLILLFPLIFIIMLSHRMVGKLVDNGSMSYILSTPNTRTKIITTQIIFLITMVFGLVFIVTIIGVSLSIVLYPGLLNIPKFLLLNLGVFFLHTLIASICFFFSCLFNESRVSLGFAIGIPVGFFIFNMIQEVSSELSFLKFFTIFTLYDIKKIFYLDNITIIYFLVMIVMSIGCFYASIYVFNKKDLPI